MTQPWKSLLHIYQKFSADIMCSGSFHPTGLSLSCRGARGPSAPPAFPPPAACHGTEGYGPSTSDAGCLLLFASSLPSHVSAAPQPMQGGIAFMQCPPDYTPFPSLGLWTAPSLAHTPSTTHHRDSRRGPSGCTRGGPAAVGHQRRQGPTKGNRRRGTEGTDPSLRVLPLASVAMRPRAPGPPPAPSCRSAAHQRSPHGLVPSPSLIQGTLPPFTTSLPQRSVQVPSCSPSFPPSRPPPLLLPSSFPPRRVFPPYALPFPRLRLLPSTLQTIPHPNIPPSATALAAPRSLLLLPLLLPLLHYYYSISFQFIPLHHSSFHRFSFSFSFFFIPLCNVASAALKTITS